MIYTLLYGSDTSRLTMQWNGEVPFKISVCMGTSSGDPIQCAYMTNSEG